MKRRFMQALLVAFTALCLVTVGCDKAETPIEPVEPPIEEGITFTSTYGETSFIDSTTVVSSGNYQFLYAISFTRDATHHLPDAALRTGLKSYNGKVVSRCVGVEYLADSTHAALTVTVVLDPHNTSGTGTALNKMLSLNSSLIGLGVNWLTYQDVAEIKVLVLP